MDLDLRGSMTIAAANGGGNDYGEMLAEWSINKI